MCLLSFPALCNPSCLTCCLDPHLVFWFPSLLLTFDHLTDFLVLIPAQATALPSHEQHLTSITWGLQEVSTCQEQTLNSYTQPLSPLHRVPAIISSEKSWLPCIIFLSPASGRINPPPAPQWILSLSNFVSCSISPESLRLEVCWLSQSQGLWWTSPLSFSP